MKNNLGKLFLFLFFPLFLLADSNLASYTLAASKSDVVTKEAVEITFKADQKDHTNSMFFFLEPKKSDAYEIILLDHTTQKRSTHDSSTTFKYLLFPLKSGDIHIDFDFTIKVASDNALAEVYTGGKDNVKWMNTTNTTQKIEPLRLHVSPLSENVDLVGEFTLDAKLQKDQINQYGSANIRYTLSGTGYNDKALQPLGKIDGVSSFTQVSDTLNTATENGYKLQKEYAYALASNKNFTIPALELSAYSPKEKKYYTLKTSSYKINVSAIDASTLVDKKDSPLSRDFHIQDFKESAIAVLIFLAGFVTAKIAPTINFKREKKQKYSDIKDAKTPQELILILIQNYGNKNVGKYIDELELLQYKKSIKTLKEIKQEVLKNIM